MIKTIVGLDEGSTPDDERAHNLKFTGAGVSVSKSGDVATVNIPGGGASEPTVSGGAALALMDSSGGEGDQGPPGPVGAAGSLGAQGPVGPALFLFEDGLPGEMGPPGIQGPQGAAGGGGGGTTGTAILDFGAFPGVSDTSVVVTGQAGIVAGSIVQAWLRPAATADHTSDEHLIETLRIEAGNIVAGTGFTIYGLNSSQINEPLERGGIAHFRVNLAPVHGYNAPMIGGRGTRLYGAWSVQWRWS